MRQPFPLNLHDKDFAEIRELREEELSHVSGGAGPCPGDEYETMITTPDGDGGPDLCDKPDKEEQAAIATAMGG